MASFLQLSSGLRLAEVGGISETWQGVEESGMYLMPYHPKR